MGVAGVFKITKLLPSPGHYESKAPKHQGFYNRYCMILYFKGFLKGQRSNLKVIFMLYGLLIKVILLTIETNKHMSVFTLIAAFILKPYSNFKLSSFN